MTFSPLVPNDVSNDLRFSASRLGMYDTCKRKHHYTYRLGYRIPYTNKALTTGLILHKLLDLWYGEKIHPATAIAVFKEREIFQKYDEQVLLWPCVALITRYVSFFYKRDNFEVLGVEKELIVPFTTPHGHQVYLHAILDLVLRSNKGVEVVDHKSSARNVWNVDMVWFDPQIALYLITLYLCGFEPKIGTINQISTSTMDAAKIGQADANKLFARFSIDPSPEVIEHWIQEIGNKIDMILEEDTYTKSLNNKRCSECAFKDACLMELRGNDPTLYLSNYHKPNSTNEVEVVFED